MRIDHVFADPVRPGHNSGDPRSFEVMRLQLDDEIADADARYLRQQIDSKEAADRAENARARIAKAGKDADAARKAENKPHDEAIARVNAKWRPLIDGAAGKAFELRVVTDAWAKAEQDRLRREAQAEADAQWQADEAERKRLEAAAAVKRKADEYARAAGVDVPDADTAANTFVPPPARPVAVVQDKIMIGTEGRRRSAAQAARLATIIDLKAAAIWLAEQEHPDLIACVQKIADRAAKARASMPGVHIS